MNLFRSPTQSWLIITLSTLAAGTISTLALTLKDPVAIILSSGLGALGGSAVTQSRKQQDSTTKADPAQEKDTLRVDLAVLQSQLQALGHTYQQTQTQLLKTQQQELSKIHSTLAARMDEIQAMLPVVSSPRLVALPSLNRDTISLSTNSGKLKTVILFDIENLTEGYKNRNGHISRVSIKDILEQIKSVEIVGEIVGQYAYADWSNSALKPIRQEISQLGIKPEQFINFEHDIKKNATDIQLSVDAIHLVQQNPIVSCVVIVSGDGGFASLAEKLRWYGKLLVGCAYDNSASKKLQAMCHHFIQIPYPVDNRKQALSGTLGETQPSATPRPILRSQVLPDSPTPAMPEVSVTAADVAEEESTPPPPLNPTDSDPANRRRRRRKRPTSELPQPQNSNTVMSPRKAMLEFADGLASKISPLTSVDPIEAAKKIQEILNAYFYASPKSAAFQTEGIFPSLVEPNIYVIIPNLKQIFLPLGIVRFNEYLRLSCRDSEFCLARAGNCLKLFLRADIPEPFTLEPDVLPKPLHDPETYRQILAADFGELVNPNGYQFKESLPSPSVLEKVGLELIQLRPLNVAMNDLVKKIMLVLDHQIIESEVRRALFVFRSAGVLHFGIDPVQPSERMVSLNPEINSPSDLHQALLCALQAKLIPILTTVAETINQEMLASLLFSLEQ
ncbi:NYN domain-containing protein [Synechococcus sp. PCC 6312]|uniref:NYN domain-containing protein n=1 Tax=Synechococcus sp. (strain ATCC 27167 / PCC 6312) TaxID=195253 RepID=UPI00029F2E11|nr:NYN domain-containing protein [Synechococcus sp. PCC 6312]AFY59979.1 hypothetical protein Syn6312_0763 [Synechococcus sp. PCC 6312]